MKVKYECIECLTRQTVTLAKKLSDDKKRQEEVISFGLKTLSEQAFSQTPPYITGQVYKYAKNLTGIEDPFKEEKEDHNKIAINLIDDLNLKKRILASDDKFDTAVRLSIAGNIIDFSVGYAIDEAKVEESINGSLTSKIYGKQTSDLKEAIGQAENILFLADNAGEIVFDQLLVSLLPKKKVTYAVKGGPIVNDATMKDVREVGMDKLVKTVETGSSIQGTVLEDCHQDFRDSFENADLIISKGQANFETLNHREDKNIFFMLRAKCQCIADEIGCNHLDFVIV